MLAFYCMAYNSDIRDGLSKDYYFCKEKLSALADLVQQCICKIGVIAVIPWAVAHFSILTV